MKVYVRVGLIGLVTTFLAALGNAQTTTCQEQCYNNYNSSAAQCDSSCSSIADPSQRRDCVRQCIATANQTYKSCISVANCNGPSSFPCSPSRCLADGRYADGTCIYICDYEFVLDTCVEDCMTACQEGRQACINDVINTFPYKYDDLGACIGSEEFCDNWFSCQMQFNCSEGFCRGECGLQ